MEERRHRPIAEQFFLKEAAKIITRNPDVGLGHARDQVAKLMRDEGFMANRIEQIKDRMTEKYLSTVFRQIGTVNPKLLIDVLLRKPMFYFVDARGAYYRSLQEIAKMPGVQDYYILHGEKDWLLSFWGTSEQEIQLESRMSKLGFVPENYDVVDVLAFRGKELPSLSDPRIILEERFMRALDRLANEPGAAQSQSELAYFEKKLKECNAFLGRATLEDHSVTGRMKVFVAIGPKIPIREGSLSVSTLRNKIPELGECMVGLYRISHYPYAAFLELVVDEYDQVDVITDKLINLMGSNSFLTLTTLCASCYEGPLSPLIGEHMSEPIAWVWYLLSPNQQAKFRALDQKRLQVIETQMDRIYTHAPGNLDEEPGRIARKALSQFVGFVCEEETANEVKGTLDRMIRSLESESRKAIARLVDLLAEGDFERLSQDMRFNLPKTDVYSLDWGECEAFFDQWNKTSPYKESLNFSVGFLDTFRDLRRIRNYIMHGKFAEWKIKEDPYDEVIFAVGEKLAACVFCMTWLTKNVLSADLTPLLAQPRPISKFCPLVGKICVQKVTPRRFRSAFIAYPMGRSQDTRDYEALMRDLGSQLESSGWEVILPSGQPSKAEQQTLFETVCKEYIMPTNFVFAEISEFNFNVLLELGYSMALGKLARPMVFIDRDKVRQTLGLPVHYTWIRYGSVNDAAGQILKIADETMTEQASGPVRIQRRPNLGFGDECRSCAKKPNPNIKQACLLFPDEAHHIDDLLPVIKEWVETRGYTTKGPFTSQSMIPDGRARLCFICETIRESDLVIADVLTKASPAVSSKCVDLAFMIGVALGFGKKVIVWQEEPSLEIADLKGLTQTYGNKEELQAKLNSINM